MRSDFVDLEVLRKLYTKHFAPAKPVFGKGKRTVHILGRERLHQAAERKIRHRKAWRFATHEEARDVEIVKPDSDGETG